jgi:diguanylate cyclase (GGDEF)-like protein
MTQMRHMLARTPPGERAEGQGYAVPAVTFDRRLALFFLLIALVPTGALVGILLFVSEDSRRGKADARLAAGLETAVAVYGDHVAIATNQAQRLARNRSLGEAVRADDLVRLASFATEAAGSARVVRIEVTNPARQVIASAGPPDAVGFAQVSLTQGGTPVGTLRVSSTDADRYVDTVRSLTQRDLVFNRAGAPLASTVTPPEVDLEAGETEDVEADDRELRAHLLYLNPDDQEAVLILGPRKEGGVLGIGRPATGILILFLAVAVILAWALARALTRLHNRVAEQAITDPLTGLWNRRYMAETLDREVSRALRFGHPISLIILDIDDFKAINDRRGHLQGDRVLEAVADVVRDATRSIDVAARYGGDELALILVETDRNGATVLAERLCEAARETEIPLRESGGAMSVTLSVGVATIPDAADGLESLVDSADRALLRAKKAGKNQIRTAPAKRTRRPGRNRTGPSRVTGGRGRSAKH